MKLSNPPLTGLSPRLVLSLLLGAAGQAAWYQHCWQYSLLGTVLWASALFFYGTAPAPKAHATAPLPSFWQWGLFTAILALALFLRTFHIQAQPPGLYIDPGFIGWGALRILHEGWRPWGIQPILLTWPTVIYQCAAWFTVVKPDLAGLSLFFTFLALSAFPFFHLFFRRLAGVPAALLTLFFMAVMYWHLNACRGELTGNQVYLYEALVLCLWLWGWETSRKWALGLSGAFLGLGIYGYQSFKFFPFLMLFLFAYEYRVDKARWRRNRTGWLLFGLVALVVMVPFVLEWSHRGIISDREKVYFIGTSVWEQRSLAPLWDSITRTAQLFNLRGDALPSGTPGGAPLLDPILGFFFLYGLFLNLRAPFERKNFYALAAFFTGLLPAILSVGDGSHRILSVIPFVAYFGARAWFDLWGRTFGGTQTRALWVGAGWALLVGCALLNAKMYFLDQPRSPDFDMERSVDATRVAQAVLSHPDTDFYLPAFYAQHYTVRYLTYSQSARVHAWDLPIGLVPAPGTGHECCFVFQKGKGGWLKLLQSLYPQGRAEDLNADNGEILATLCFVPSASIAAARDGQMKGPGCFAADQPGRYRFQVPKGSSLRIAGKAILSGGALALAQGFYSLELHGGDRGLSFIGPDGTTRSLEDHWTRLPLDHGLLCRFTSPGLPAPWFGWTPVINITNTGDLPEAAASFEARWTGRLECPVSGDYDLRLLTNETGALEVDGQALTPDHSRITLKQGAHSVILSLSRQRRENRVNLDCHLLWKRPGQDRFEVIPMSAFGRTAPLKKDPMDGPR